MIKTKSNIFQRIDNKIIFFSKNTWISLLVVGITGFIIRIIFLHTDIPMNSDNFLYFTYTINLIQGYSDPNLQALLNDGWSHFLAPFFLLMNSTNFMDYMALQKYISVIISVLAIIPLYYFGRNFLSKSYSIFGCVIFVLEPRIIQNSLFGITEPLYLIGVTISLALFFNKKNIFQLISFVVISLTTLIRAEAMFLIIIFGIIFIVQKGISKKTFLHVLLISMIVLSILYPIAEIRTQKTGNDGLLGRITAGVDHFESVSENNEEKLINLLFNGGVNLIKFLGWSQIPLLIFFVPVGLILILKSRNFYEKSILAIGVVGIIPSIYVYSFASDSRYLFVVYPILSIIAVYALKYYFIKIQNKKMVASMIFLLIFSTSFIYLDLKDNYKQDLELYNLSIEISKRVKIVNDFYPESSYLKSMGYTKIQKFPITSEELLKENVTVVWISKINSIEKLIEFSHINGITHLVVDEKDRDSQILKQIYQNEDNYPFLIKEFDSKDYGYKYHLKIFKINYEEFRLMNK